MNEVDAASVDGRLFIDHHDRYRSFFFVLFFSFLFFFFGWHSALDGKRRTGVFFFNSL